MALALIILCAFFVWSLFYLGIVITQKSSALFRVDNSNISLLPQNDYLIVNDIQTAQSEGTDAMGVIVITQSEIRIAEGFVLSSFFIYFIIATNVSNYNLFPNKTLTLNQTTRQNIYDIIMQNEGVHLREICRLLDKKMGVIQYHIYILESANLINSLKDGRYKRFFINHQDAPEKQIIISLLQRETTARVLNLILQGNGEGISHSSIARELNSSSQAITWHVQKMLDSNVIQMTRRGCQKYYQISPKFLPIVEALQ